MLETLKHINSIWDKEESAQHWNKSWFCTCL